MTRLRGWWRRLLLRERLSGALIVCRAVVGAFRHSGWLAYVLVVLMGAAGMYRIEQITDEQQDQRREAVKLLCQVEHAFEEFVRAGPDLPRDAEALDRLEQLDCARLRERVRTKQP